MFKFASRILGVILLSACLGGITPSAYASAVGFPFVAADTSGNRVSGVTVAIGGVTLTAGTPATVTGYSLSTGTAVTTCSVTLANPGALAFYTLNYDAAATGDVYFPLTITKAATTFAAITDLPCSVDASNASNALTQATSASTASTSNGTAITAVNTKLGAPAGASVSADIATANTAIGALPSSTTITNLLVAVGLSSSNATKVAAFAAALNGSTGAVTLPTTAPAGYGGSGGVSVPYVHR